MLSNRKNALLIDAAMSLSLLGYKFIQVLSDNDKKKTAVLKVEKDTELFVAKLIFKDTKSDVIEAFNREKKFYRHNFLSVPTLVYEEPQIFILRYVGDNTMGDICFSGQGTNENIISVMKCIDIFYGAIKQRKSQGYDISALTHYSSVLIGSGPRQTGSILNIVGVNKKLLKIILFFLLKIIGGFFFLFNKGNPNFMLGVSHGDYHYNNIVINNDNAYMVDFERSDFKGFFIIDVIYLLVILEQLRYRNNYDVSIVEMKRKYVKGAGLKAIYWIYKYAVKNNPKFV